MLLDRSHVKWAVVSGGIALGSGIHYARYAATAPHGPTGGSVDGLMYGVITALLILFATSLTLRRLVPGWRIGRATSWLKAHIWLSLLAVPFALFHSGMSMGSGTLTFVLMVLLLVIEGSGIFGLYMQHLIPQRMTVRCPMEAPFEQIDRLLSGLAQEAFLRVKGIIDALPIEHRQALAGVAGPLLDPMPQATGAVGPPQVANPESQPLATGTKHELFPLVDFYLGHVRPFLSGEPSSLDRDSALEGAMVQVRMLVPTNVYSTVDALGRLCEERKQLLRQKGLHTWLHIWLFAHVPLSMVLVVLMLVHAIQSLRY